MYKNMLKNAQKFESDRFCDFIGFIRYDCFQIRGIIFKKKKIKILRIFVATEEFYIPGGLVARIAASYKLALVFMTNNFKSRGTVRHHAVGHISGMGAATEKIPVAT